MHYIRFLKTPKLTSASPDANAPRKITAVIALESDLGDTYYPIEAELDVKLISNSNAGPTSLLRRRGCLWEAGMRSLKLEMDLERHEMAQAIQLDVELSKAAAARSIPGLLDGTSVIVGARSVPLVPDQQSQAARLVQRTFCLSGSKSLTVFEDCGQSIARHVWDAGVMLSACLASCLANSKANALPDLQEKLTSQRSLRVIELGAGCGIVGMTFAQILPRCHVFLTDLIEAEEIIIQNLRHIKPAQDSKAEFYPLEWGNAISSDLQSPFDIIVFSDCTYNPDSAGVLTETLSMLAKFSPDPLILGAMKTRHPSEAVFFEHMSRAAFETAGCQTLKTPGCSANGIAENTDTVDIYTFRPRMRDESSYSD